MPPLDSRVALITGASRGIGRILAQELAAAGAAVVITDVDPIGGQAVATEIERQGHRSAFITTDIRSKEEIQAAVSFAAQQFGALDIVVNNAKPRLTPSDDLLHEWDLAMDVLLKGPTMVVEAAMPHLIKSGRGSIVNISSSNAVSISQQPASYHLAKAALEQLTRYLAYEFGASGVRSNAVRPALVDLHDEGRRPLTAEPVNRRATELAVPLGHAAEAQAIAKAVVFLCSDDAAYINGHILTVDGGVGLGDHFRLARTALTDRNGS